MINISADEMKVTYVINDCFPLLSIRYCNHPFWFNSQHDERFTLKHKNHNH
ncbi:hypothetical protein HanRHA438_Chr03g0132391 [Helianthus annuus]|nr:hypothetical protein HanRHA438_Chr03g0132391 [Helianthus annuus]